MRHNLEFLKADLSDELGKLALLAEQFALAKDRLSVDELPSYDRGAVGYLLHNFYNGCESIFCGEREREGEGTAKGFSCHGSASGNPPFEGQPGGC